MKAWTLTVIGLLALIMVACGGEAEPTPTKTPRPTATFTPLPTLAAALPLVESDSSGATQPPDTATVASEEAPAPNLADDAVSPLTPPSPTPEPTPTPGFEAQPPIPVLAADLTCGDGCDAGNPNGIGAMVFNLDTGQANTWVANLDPLADQEYEGWLVELSTGAVESTGRFNTDPDGTAGAFFVISGAAKDVPWNSFVLTIEPEPDDDPAPAAPHSIGGPLRSTFMGEALFNRFDIACGRCHGAAGEGGDGPALTATSLPFAQFEAAVRAHDGDLYGEGVLGSRDLQHIAAWLTSLP